MIRNEIEYVFTHITPSSSLFHFFFITGSISFHAFCKCSFFIKQMYVGLRVFCFPSFVPSNRGLNDILEWEKISFHQEKLFCAIFSRIQVDIQFLDVFHCDRNFLFHVECNGSNEERHKSQKRENETNQRIARCSALEKIRFKI